MTSATHIENQLADILHDAAKKLDLKKYSPNLNLDVLKGDGFLGEFYKVSIVDDDSKTEFHLAIKRAPTDPVKRQKGLIEVAYKNEIRFYSQIYPAFNKFEKEHQVTEPFNLIPKYITSCSNLREEIIVFEDITKLGYVLREKEQLLDDEHARLVFKTYGHFHAISFCLRDQKPDEFYKLSEPLAHIWQEFGRTRGFNTALSKVVEKCFESLNTSKNAAVIEKFKKYTTDVTNIFQESLKYDGQYSGILHGDCWSNNMMFKYTDSQKQDDLKSMNLLDFQLLFVGTPVYDLSYFFYTGGSKDLFDKLEEYLDVYYESFSKAARNLGGDPNNLFPRRILSEEWRKYSRLGMLLSLLLTKIKLMSKEDSIQIMETSDNDKNKAKRFMEINYNSELFEKRVCDIIIHMGEINAL